MDVPRTLASSLAGAKRLRGGDDRNQAKRSNAFVDAAADTRPVESRGKGASEVSVRAGVSWRASRGGVAVAGPSLPPNTVFAIGSG
jgi:hypothetical protein